MEIPKGGSCSLGSLVGNSFPPITVQVQFHLLTWGSNLTQNGPVCCLRVFAFCQPWQGGDPTQTPHTQLQHTIPIPEIIPQLLCNSSSGEQMGHGGQKTQAKASPDFGGSGRLTAHVT